MAIDLVTRRVEEGVAFIGTASGNVRGPHHPEGDPFLPAGVDIPAISKGHLGIGSVDGAAVHVRETALATDENLP
jgi:hypothetical protein